MAQGVKNLVENGLKSEGASQQAIENTGNVSNPVLCHTYRFLHAAGDTPQHWQEQSYGQVYAKIA